MAGVSGVVFDFFAELHRSGIRYCHWKSNNRLDRSLAGGGDLDLLIDPRDEAAFRALAPRAGLARFVDVVPPPCPGIEDWFRLDPDTGRLAHFHVHFRLLIGPGDDRVFRLPLEESLIAGASPVGPCAVRVPTPEMEILVLCARALLKLNPRAVSRFAGLRRLFRRKPVRPLGKNLSEQIRDLASRVDRAKLAEVERSHATWVPEGTVGALTGVAAGCEADPRVLRALRADLMRRLEAGRQVSRVRCALWHAKRTLAAWMGKDRLQRLAQGHTVALVGSDGSGKSTHLAQIVKDLSKRLDTRVFYMGGKEFPWSVRPFRSIRKRARELHKWGRKRRWIGRRAFRAIEALNRVAHAHYYLSIGRLRLSNQRRGRRLAQRGTLALYDRYPLPELTDTMDGPYSRSRLAEDWPEVRSLRRIEQRLYERIAPPDAVLLIDVSPEEALRRKPDHDLETIRRKSRAVAQSDIRSARAVRIRGDAAREEVLRHVRASLWKIVSGAVPEQGDRR